MHSRSGGLLEENVLARTNFKRGGWSGVDTTGDILHDGNIHPQESNSLWVAQSRSMFTGSNVNMWQHHYKAYDSVFMFIVDASGQFWVRSDISGPAIVYYRKILFSPMFKNESAPMFNENDSSMWPIENSESMWKQYSDRVIVSKNDVIQIKVHSLNSSLEETVINDIEAIVDVPDRNEHFEDLFIAKEGTQLPIITPHYKTTAVHIDALQGGAVNFQFISRTPCVIKLIDKNGDSISVNHKPCVFGVLSPSRITPLNLLTTRPSSYESK